MFCFQVQDTKFTFFCCSCFPRLFTWNTGGNPGFSVFCGMTTFCETKGCPTSDYILMPIPPLSCCWLKTKMGFNAGSDGILLPVPSFTCCWFETKDVTSDDPDGCMPNSLFGCRFKTSKPNLNGSGHVDWRGLGWNFLLTSLLRWRLSPPTGLEH